MSTYYYSYYSTYTSTSYYPTYPTEGSSNDCKYNYTTRCRPSFILLALTRSELCLPHLGLLPILPWGRLPHPLLPLHYLNPPKLRAHGVRGDRSMNGNVSILYFILFLGSGGDAGSSISLLSLFQNYQNIGGGVSPLGGGGGTSFVLGGNSYSNSYNGYNSPTVSPGFSDMSLWSNI